MSLLPRAVFAALAVATFGAFFLAQRLKHAPTAIQRPRATGTFSPDGDGVLDRVNIAFSLKQADHVDVLIVDRGGDRVARLADDRPVAAYTPTKLVWDGRGDDGRLVPDGLYRMRIVLRGEGRSITVPKGFVKDLSPPRPYIRSIGPDPAAGVPEVLPRRDGKPALVTFYAPGNHLRIELYRTGPRPSPTPVLVARPDTPTTWAWDGKLAGGAPAPAGTYLVVVRVRDRANNLGTSPKPQGSAFGVRLSGAGGITVRDLGVSPPSGPVRAVGQADVFIDSRQQPWTASLRRLGASRRPIARYRGTRAKLHLTLPAGPSGVYLLSVRTATAQQRVPIMVQAPHLRRVLVVLPWITWQGRNPVDDNGDGLPDLLDRGVGVRAQRVFTGDGLPSGFATHEAPVLAFLDRTHRRYDVTSDLALATDPRADLSGYQGVLLPGDTRWLPTALGRRLRDFVRVGGTVASLGTDSLRREVTPRRSGRLVRPTVAAPTDLFGATLDRVIAGPTTLTNEQDDINLFAGGTGQFTGLNAIEPTRAAGAGVRRVAAAVTPEGRAVVVAVRFGRGLVIRTGLPDLADRLNADRNSAALLGRTWTLLSR